jgi:hypothetical protein
MFALIILFHEHFRLWVLYESDSIKIFIILGNSCCFTNLNFKLVFPKLANLRVNTFFHQGLQLCLHDML